MIASRATCMLIALAFFVQAFAAPTEPLPPNSNDTTTSQPLTTASTPIPTTLNPNTTTPSTKPTNPTPETTTPVTTTTITTPATTPTTASTTPVPTSPVTTPSPTQPTTAIPPTSTPCPPDERHFDGPSFMGGILLTAGLFSIGFILWKFYKARTERNYHTL